MNKKSYRKLLLLFYFLMVQSWLSAQEKPIFTKAYSPRIADYKIDVILDDKQKTIDGKMQLTWVNKSHDKIEELQFHMYLNAFKNTKSSFMKESGGRMRGAELDDKHEIPWGWVEILDIKMNKREELTDVMEYIQPDDGNTDDQTVLSVPLIKFIEPGDTILLDIIFKSKLPKVFARTGFSHDYFFVGQWFPKIGVYEPSDTLLKLPGKWNCHQYHSNSEYFADFANYDVSITLPHKYVVGSCGVSQNEKDNNDGTKTIDFRMEDIVDFAWTASPNFIRTVENWKHVEINVLMQNNHRRQAKRYISSAIEALEYFEKKLGKYPYPILTIVDPPFHAMGSGGMEYTTLITAGTLWGLPKGVRLPEMVTIHEFGHAYFMGMLATNEAEEAWMDEGMNSYFESRIMDEAYGEGKSLFEFYGLEIGDKEYQRAGYVGMQNPKIAESIRYSWEFEHGGYGALSYSKPATWLNTLERIIGTETMDEIMKTYFDRWKFKHPKTKDFIAVANEIVKKNHKNRFGKNLDWYFEQVLFGSDVCDYKLARIKNREIKEHIGIFEVGNNKIEVKKRKKNNKANDNKKNKAYKSSVIIHRLGEVIVPQEVLIGFSDGKEILKRWDGRSRTKEFKFEGENKIAWAKVDPNNKILIDLNMNNNSKIIKSRKAPYFKYWSKFLFAVQNIMQFFSILF